MFALKISYKIVALFTKNYPSDMTRNDPPIVLFLPINDKTQLETTRDKIIRGYYLAQITKLLGLHLGSSTQKRK